MAGCFETDKIRFEVSHPEFPAVRTESFEVKPLNLSGEVGMSRVIRLD